MRLERVFEDIGFPDAIRSDNGTPFGSTGAAGFGAVGMVVQARHRAPLHPSAAPAGQGRHERMHRTLKAETSKPPARTAAEQQQRFDTFRRHYNEQRPHEALGQKPPVALAVSVAHPARGRLDDPWYDADHEARRVRPPGISSGAASKSSSARPSAGELVGLAEHDSGGHIVRFSGRDLGVIGRDRRFLRFAPPRARLRVAPQTAETAEQ